MAYDVETRLYCIVASSMSSVLLFELPSVTALGRDLVYIRIETHNGRI